MELKNTTDVRKIIVELKNNSAIDRDSLDLPELARALLKKETDFESGEFRFIHEDKIDEILAEELGDDLYVLGCFRAEFLATVMNVSKSAIEKIQKAEAYEALGELIKSGGHLPKLVEKYVKAGGYGDHFARYDGYQHKVGEYYFFRIN